MTIKESQFFSYDNEDSSDYGIVNVKLSSRLAEEPFSSEREITEVSVRGRTKPYFKELIERPLSFSVEFMFEDRWDSEKIRKVARWLLQDYYKELYFSDNPDRIFFAIVDSTPTLVHNMLKQGYVKLNFRCNDAYSYSPLYSEEYDFTSSGGGTIEFFNDGDLELYPELSIYIGSTGLNSNDVSIVNNSIDGYEFKFTGLDENETIYVDNENEFIETDKYNTYRFDNFNENFLYFAPYSKNSLQVTGNCKIEFTYRFKLRQG